MMHLIVSICWLCAGVWYLAHEHTQSGYACLILGALYTIASEVQKLKSRD